MTGWKYVPTAMGGSYVVSGKDTIRDFAIIGGVVVLVFVAPEVYLYAMVNPEITVTAIGIADNLFLGGTPASTIKELGASELRNYNPWAVK